MAYQYFSQQLVNSNILDLSQVFPDKQQTAKERNNVAYNLGDIVIFLQDITKNFKVQDNKYMDLDNGIREIILRYYKEQNLENPFEIYKVIEEDKYDKGIVPREAAVVKDGKIKGQGVAKVPNQAVAEAVAVAEVSSDEALIQRIDELKKTLSRKKKFLSLLDDEEKKVEVDRYMRKLMMQEELALEELEDAKNENRQPDPYTLEKIKVLKDFMNV